MFGISTAWNTSRHTNGKQLIKELQEIGFNSFELGAELDERMFLDILPLICNKEIQIISLHNYFPRIKKGFYGKNLLDAYLLSSLDDDERKKAIEYTKKTIAIAADLKIPAVVIHLGEVPTHIKTHELFSLYIRRDTRFFRSLRDELAMERKQNVRKHLNKSMESLEELNDLAVKADVKIGLETRYYYEDIPNLEEFEVIFKHFKGGNIFYWHDTGHGQLMENLGFYQHEDFLQNFKGHMIGIHLHDIIGYSDHRAPGTGEMDFNMIKKYLTEDIYKIFEIHRVSHKEAVKKSLNFMQKLLAEG